MLDEEKERERCDGKGGSRLGLYKKWAKRADNTISCCARDMGGEEVGVHWVEKKHAGLLGPGHLGRV